jgi:hypothetical protein
MGITCACQKVESEEETIGRILSTMNLTEIETKCAYAEFSKCINKDDGYLDFFLFKTFISKIIGDNNYKSAQNTFFENLRKMDNNKKNIRRIGAMIIYLSKGSKFSKVNTLYEHFINYYNGFNERSVKEFLNDLIDTNTDNCILSFRENLGYDGTKNITEIYKKLRKRKLLNYILINYESLKIKYFHFNKGLPVIQNVTIVAEAHNDKLNNSLDMTDEKDIDQPRRSIEHENGCDAYERYSKSQCDLLMNFNRSESKGRPENDDEKIVKEFIELSFNQLSGEYIRNWLYDDYLKEKSYENVCI